MKEHNYEDRGLKCETTQSTSTWQSQTNMALRCELVARKNHLAWQWTVTANWVMENGVYITEMASGRDFVVYLTASGRLLQCGQMPRPVSYDKFRLCHGRRHCRAHAVRVELKRLTKREREVYDGHTCDSSCCPIELPMTEKIRVRQVACGATHCVVLGEIDANDGGRLGLFAWGLGEYGQLGLGDCQLVSKMTLIAAPPKLDALLKSSSKSHPTLLRCSAFSTYLLSRGSSILWHWGLLPSVDQDSRFVRQGVPVQFPLLDENIHVVDVAAGVEHIVILSEDGYVFTWGHGSYGQLGIGPSITSNVDSQPTQVDFFHQEPNYRIVAISCGWDHSIALTRNGDVYAWGNNAYGACGAKSKFCEYFQPVLVAVPRPVKLGLASSNEQVQIRCGGNSSALLFHRATDEYAAINRAFVWGVSAPGISTLLPIEVFCRAKRSKFAYCCLRLESSVWLLDVGGKSSIQDVAPVWIVKEIGAHGEYHQGFERELPCLSVDVGTKICIQVQAITKSAAYALESANNVFELTLKSDSLASSSDENNYTSVPIYSVTRKAQSDQVEVHPIVEINYIAQVKGRTTISLTSSIGEVVGGKFLVDIALPNEYEAITLENTEIEHGNQDNSIRILGVHVEGTTESQERVDTKWYKLLSKRIRVYTDDTVIVLIESTTNNMDPAIQVEYRNNHWHYGLTHLDVVGGDNKARGQHLSVAQLRFPSPGQYLIYDTKTRDNELDHRTLLVVVSCCMARQERQRVLKENHDLVMSRYQSAFANVPQPARFSFFLSSILQHAALRDSIVCSPWITTYDEECCEPKFDFDREYDAQYVLMRHDECPFILWDPCLTSSSTVDTLQQHTEDTDPLSLISVLPNWAEDLALKVAFRIATWLEKPGAGPTHRIKELPIDEKEVRLKAAATGVSVQQVPFDFLRSVSLIHQPAVRDALVLVNPNIIGVHDSIVSWRRTNGDLLYTVKTNELLVRRYGHESHDFPETAQSGRITRLISELSNFLWQAAEGKKIEDLFLHLTTPTKQRLKLSKDPITSSIHNVIHLRELIFHTTTLGFAEVIAVPKQEWFALFRGIQVLSPPTSAGITFSTFRTFLIDPFHQFFWKQYVHLIREQTNSSREMIARTLADSFKVSERLANGIHRNNNESENSSDDEILMVPWLDFVESLRSFHSILGLKPLPPSDCCRLLYRFDTLGNGRISIQTYREALLHALDDIHAATERYDFKAQSAKTSKGKQSLKVAIINGHRRPNVELFTSSEAVHKLFAARARTCTNPNNPTQIPSREASQSTRTITNRATDAAAVLRASANTHLARIRNLPLSHLLREGIHFRPPRESSYRCEDQRDSTQAQAIDAEDSY